MVFCKKYAHSVIIVQGMGWCTEDCIHCESPVFESVLMED